MEHISKLPNLEPSIFSVMSALAHKHNAINLSQGFPNFKGDQKYGCHLSSLPPLHIKFNFKIMVD